MKRDKIVNIISHTMHQNHPDAEVVLYGSEARGDARPDSDFDLLVLVNRTGKEFRNEQKQIADSILGIEMQTGTNISPYIVPRDWWENQPFPTPFYNNVVREGIKI